jgi:hypothetical protein
MTSLRNVLLWGSLLVLSACASQTLKPDQAPEYVITNNFTPFFSERPVAGSTTDISLREKTRVKLLRKGSRYSLVQLEDSRTGYVSSKNISVAPPELQQTPSGVASDEPQTTPPRRNRISRVARRTPTPTPVLQEEKPKAPPAQERAVPPPSPAAPPLPAAPPPSPTPSPKAEVDVSPPEAPTPSPTPTPQATPLEKPKFRL